MLLAAAAGWADTLARTGAAAESLRALAQAESVSRFQAFLETWHDFYLLTGTAAATLAGLLFIALSLHMEVLVQDPYRSMLVVARATLTSFVTVLIVSMMLLVPHPAIRPTGLALILFVVLFGGLTLTEMRGAMKHDHADFPRRTVSRRVLIPLIGYGLMAMVGVGFLQRRYAMAYAMVSAMSLLLANAAWASWDLLVRVSRVKERAKRGG